MRHFLILSICLFLTACGGSVSETVGLEKAPPDEFQVIRRAPLSLPPDYALRPPRPGAPRPQEQSPDVEAAQTVFGLDQLADRKTTKTSGEAALLGRAGTEVADPNVRQVIDAETAELRDRNKPVAERLLGLGGDADEPSASVVDAAAEAERLKKNAEDGKPVTEGETPSIEE